MLPACRGVQSGHHVKLITEIQNAGAKVTISKLDVVDPEQAKELVALAEGIAPIAAIFHLAMILDDRMLINQVLNMHAVQSYAHHTCTAKLCMPPCQQKSPKKPWWARAYMQLLATESMLCGARRARAGIGV